MCLRFRRLFLVCLLSALFFIPALSHAIEIDIQKTHKVEARYVIEVDGQTVSDSVSSSSNPATGLEQYLASHDACATIDVFSSVSAKTDPPKGNASASILLEAKGDFSSYSDIIFNAEGEFVGFRPAKYNAGAYAGIDATLTTKPSSGGYDTFWGHEVEGMPVVVTSKYYNTVDINPSCNFATHAYSTEYQLGRDKFEAAYGAKSDGGGESTYISPEQIPDNYHFTDEEARSYLSNNRTGAASDFPIEKHHGQYSADEPRTKTSFSQLGNKVDFIAETDFRMETLRQGGTSQAHFDTTVSYTLGVQMIQDEAPFDIDLKLITGVPSITQQTDPNDARNPFDCKYASEAMIARYWANDTFQYISSEENPVPSSDIDLMQHFKKYEADLGKNKLYQNYLNAFFDEFVNPAIKDPEDKICSLYFSEITGEEYIREIEGKRPIMFAGNFIDLDGNSIGYGHVSVGYGFLGVENSITGEDSGWVAINDTLDNKYNIVDAEDGDRLWVQEGGDIKEKYGYATVKWYPTPSIEEQKGLFIPGGQGLSFRDRDGTSVEIQKDAEWIWQEYYLTGPVSQMEIMARYYFNSPMDLEHVFAINNTLGTMGLVNAPPIFGSAGNVLYLMTPDGSPIGFGMDIFFPEDFEVSFKYAGIGNGVFQVLLNDTLLRELNVTAQDLGELLSFDEMFHASDLGITPYKYYRLSFILKSAGDPEFYFDDLTIRNLNFGNHGHDVVPEPATLILLGFGLGGLLLKTKRPCNVLN